MGGRFWHARFSLMGFLGLFGRWVVLVAVIVTVMGGFYLLNAFRAEWGQTASQRAPTPATQGETALAPTTSPASPSEPPVQHQTATWKTYVNAFDNYSLRYPSTWFINPASEAGNATDISDTDLSQLDKVPKPPDTDHIRVNILAFHNTERIPLSMWIDSHITSQVYSQTEIALAGTTGVIREESNSDFLQLGHIERTITIYLSHNDRVYRILAFPANSKHRGTFTTILSTFRPTP